MQCLRSAVKYFSSFFLYLVYFVFLLHYNLERICGKYVKLFFEVKKHRELKRRPNLRENKNIYNKENRQKSINQTVIKIDVINNIETIEKEINENEFPIVNDDKFGLFLKSQFNIKLMKKLLNELYGIQIP